VPNAHQPRNAKGVVDKYQDGEGSAAIASPVDNRRAGYQLPCPLALAHNAHS